MFPITNTVFPLCLTPGLIHLTNGTQGKGISFLQAVSAVTKGAITLNEHHISAIKLSFANCYETCCGW